MVEMGLIDLDSLTVYLGLELGISIATRATLERAKRTAVRLLTPELAVYFRCIPIIVQDRQLIAAVDDPHDIEMIDELTRITGYRVIPRVAPEIRIFYYLERYYGVPRPPRFARFGDKSSAASAQITLPAPPLPGLPPPSTAPASGPSSLQISRMPAAGERGHRRLSEEHEELKDDADALVTRLDSDTAASAEAAPRQSTSTAGASGPAIAYSAPTAFAALELEPAMAAMDSATQRGHVADAIMSYAINVFDVAALCLVRDNMAFGWKASGPSLDRERIETLLIPLDAPSMFQMAIHNDNLFHAPPFPATLHTYLYRVLRCRPPLLSTVVVISIGKRVVNLLYGHRFERDELSDQELEELRHACRAATAAYVRLIAASKKATSSKNRSDRRPGVKQP